MEDLLAKLGKENNFFAKIDLESAYHQIKLDKGSQPLTTIITHLGTFQYTRMPFGVKSAPSAFQRIINNVLNDQSNILCYLDDILVSAKSKLELSRRLKRLMDVLHKHNIQINKEKSTFCTKQTEWLG